MIEMAILHIYTLKNSKKVKRQSALAGCFFTCQIAEFCWQEVIIYSIPIFGYNKNVYRTHTKCGEIYNKRTYDVEKGERWFIRKQL